MARRGKSQARRQGSSSTPIWAWLLIGLFAGAVCYFGYQQYLAFKKPAADLLPVPQANADKDADKKTTEPPASGNDDGVLDTDYSFYDVLPSTDPVAVVEEPISENSDSKQPAKTPTDAELAALKTAEKSAVEPVKPVSVPDKATVQKTEKPISEPAKISNPEPTRYVLQAGSFESSADADDLKARIAMTGQQAHVEQIEANGKTMYRVRLGPFDNADAANAAKSSLSGQGISADKISIK
ncbi:MAG: SPOR domain-containing protein [Arenimonas sp.]|nr:SPOR domain-containing protein [Arenimonas sp.]